MCLHLKQCEKTIFQRTQPTWISKKYIINNPKQPYEVETGALYIYVSNKWNLQYKQYIFACALHLFTTHQQASNEPDILRNENPVFANFLLVENPPGCALEIGTLEERGLSEPWFR